MLHSRAGGSAEAFAFLGSSLSHHWPNAVEGENTTYYCVCALFGELHLNSYVVKHNDLLHFLKCFLFPPTCWLSLLMRNCYKYRK